MKQKLFELLAIIKDTAKTSDAEMKAAKGMFGNADTLFTGMLTNSEKIDDSAPDIPAELRPLQHNVDTTLSVMWRSVGKHINTAMTLECANADAGGQVYLGDSDIPFLNLTATALLNLEQRLADIESVYKAIPTLPLTEVWHFDNSLNAFVSKQRTTIRTAKMNKVIVKYAATKEHPAQTELIKEDVPAYAIERMFYSGAMTATEKRDRLERLGILQKSVKQARQRANTVEVEDASVADAIMLWIDEGITN